MTVTHVTAPSSTNIYTALKSILFVAMLWCAPTLAHAEDKALTAEIGGRFMLEDHNGQIVTDQDFGGRYLLITFGYTFCPDVCPTNLVNMSQALDELGEKATKIAPIFITVDPARDTTARLRDYVANFDERLIGLTGPQPMIDNVSRRYKVVSAIHHPEGWAKDEYLVDHTASIFLMAPDNTFLVKFAHGLAPKEMAARIAELVQ